MIGSAHTALPIVLAPSVEANDELWQDARLWWEEQISRAFRKPPLRVTQWQALLAVGINAKTYAEYASALENYLERNGPAQDRNRWSRPALTKSLLQEVRLRSAPSNSSYDQAVLGEILTLPPSAAQPLQDCWKLRRAQAFLRALVDIAVLADRNVLDEVLASWV